MYQVRSTKYNVQSRKYSRNAIEINRASLPAADRLGEIGNSGTISVYFTCLPQAGGVYFYNIPLYYFTKRSEVCFNPISTVFPFYYFTKRSEVYFYHISTVFPFYYFTELPAAAGVSILFPSYFLLIISRSVAKSISIIFPSYFHFIISRSCPPRRVFQSHFHRISYQGITTFLYLAAMENFVVSARKYRPADFKSVVGQQHITTTLQNAIKNKHLAQAFLFCGPRGVGKTTCARILAKTINCESITKDFEACGTCSSCVSFQNNASFNVYELDAASNNSVDDIRNLVEQVRYAPQKGEYKVYIIDEVHMLSTAAFNAFLKTLEEPPKYAIFILATTEKHKIIPTILSRCQIFDFNRIQIKHIAEHLKYIAGMEVVDYEEEALRLIATKADGALRDALSMFDLIVTYSAGKKVTYLETIANLNILDYDYYFKVVDALLEENISTTLLLFDEILKKGFDGHNFIVGLSEHLRDLLVVKDEATVELLQVSESAKERYLVQTARASVSFLLSALNLANQCDIHYKTSKNQRLHVELTLMKVAKLSQAFRLATLATVDAKKKA
jgi:DNA polymerase-3 subunit gamma/tau